MSTRGGLGEEGIVILDNGNNMSIQLLQMGTGGEGEGGGALHSNQSPMNDVCILILILEC